MENLHRGKVAQANSIARFYHVPGVVRRNDQIRGKVAHVLHRNMGHFAPNLIVCTTFLCIPMSRGIAGAISLVLEVGHFAPDRTTLPRRVGHICPDFTKLTIKTTKMPISSKIFIPRFREL